MVSLGSNPQLLSRSQQVGSRASSGLLASSNDITLICAAPLLEVPSHFSGDTSVVDTASWAHPKKGKPPAQPEVT